MMWIVECIVDCLNAKLKHLYTQRVLTMFCFFFVHIVTQNIELNCYSVGLYQLDTQLICYFSDYEIVPTLKNWF